VADKYRIQRLIGQGAMGAVFAARHELLQKQVALKLISDECARAPDAVRRFFDEARAAAAIESEHVVRVLDVGQTISGFPFMALELLEGCDLAQLLEDSGPLPVHEVVDWILQALEALAEAHSLGIVHRDLKPANLYLARRRDGTRVVKVLDFGISKIARLPGESPTLTATSAILGSPVYMAPEQLRSARSVDARADIWAIGVVLYELLTGRIPFQGDSVAQVFVAVLEHSAPALRKWRADLPPALEEVVRRCLSRDVERRIRNVADLAEALAPFGRREVRGSVQRTRHILRTAAEWTRAETPSRRPPKRHRRVVVAAALGIGAVAALSLLASRNTSDSPAALQQAAPAASSAVVKTR
jgi:serine/threonine-protein kinase